MLLTLRGHEDKVFRLTFSADGTTLFSESPSNGMIVWHAPRQ